MTGVTTDDEVRENTDGRIAPVGMEDWTARVKARLLHGLPGQKVLVCEGETGVGKSEITKQVCQSLGLNPIICPGLGAQQMEEFLALVKLEKGDDGVPKILQAVHENLIPTQKLVDSGKYTITVKGKKRTVIPWIIDEIFTGNQGQMNQLRGFLTFQQTGSVDIPRETMILGTTNPEDIIYSSRKSVDAAIMDRIEVVRVKMDFEMHQTFLARLEKAGEYPEACRMFLRMEENKDQIWPLASPRFWHITFGGTWYELSRADMNEDRRIRLFDQSLSDYFQQVALRFTKRRSSEKIPMTAEALISRFRNFIQHGDDPHYYPISANSVMGAGKEAARQQVELMKYWKKEEKFNFIGVTVQDLTTVICDSENLSLPQADHVAQLLDVAGSAMTQQLFTMVHKKCPGTEKFDTLFEAIKKHPSLAKAIEDAIDQEDRVMEMLNQKKREAKESRKHDLVET